MNASDENQHVADEVIELGDEEGLDSLEDVAQEAVKAVEAVREAHRDDEDHCGESSERVAHLECALAEAQDRASRTLADFENYRKRTAREREEALRFAAAESLREFLDVMDNLERALSAGGSIDDLKLGVEMIHRQMIDLLRRSGVEVVAAVGEVFDPALHEAVSRQEDPEVDQPTVSTELQKGYSIHGRLLRPARVTVAVPPEESAEQDDGNAE